MKVVACMPTSMPDSSALLHDARLRAFLEYLHLHPVDTPLALAVVELFYEAYQHAPDDEFLENFVKEIADAAAED